MIRAALLFMLWFLVWLFLSWPPGSKDLIYAAIVSVFVSFMTLDLFAQTAGTAKGSKPGPLGVIKRCAWFVWYVVIFIWECFKANIDVAYRVIHPELPIRPGTVKVKVALRSDIGLTFLANSITLTPGTTSIDVDKESGYLYVHQLCVGQPGGRLRVVERFEGILKRIFE